MTDDGDDRNDVTTSHDTVLNNTAANSVKTDPVVSAASVSENAASVSAAAGRAREWSQPKTPRRARRRQLLSGEGTQKTTFGPAGDSTRDGTHRRRRRGPLRDPDEGVREAACELFGSLREHALHAGVVETMQSLCANDGGESVRDAAIVSPDAARVLQPAHGAAAQDARSGGGAAVRAGRQADHAQAALEPVPPNRVRGERHDPGLVAGRRVLLRGARARLGPREGHAHTLVYILDGVQEDLDLKKGGAS